MTEKIKQIFTAKNDQMPLALLFALVIMFWAIFDSTIQYITPLIIQQQGYTNSEIGLIIGFSSVAGAVFDFFVYKIFKNTSFRRMILVMFSICFAYPLLLWGANSVWLFLIAMSIWGIYYDFYGFGMYNFVTKQIKRDNYASSFGVIQVFKSLGNIIAPLVISLVVIQTVDWHAFAVGWIALIIGLSFFIWLLYIIKTTKNAKNSESDDTSSRNLFVELHLWRHLGTLLKPVLIVAFYYHIIDAFFWTLIPLYAKSIDYQQFGGLFLATYSIPALIAGWFVGSLTKRFGKKRSAYSSLLIGSMILSLFFFTKDPIALIVIVFLSSFFTKLTNPVMNSSFADYINDAPQVEVEIEGLKDLSKNIGYLIGPIAAGILADLLGMQAAFGMLGIIGSILAIYLLIFGPKHIIINSIPKNSAN